MIRKIVRNINQNIVKNIVVSDGIPLPPLADNLYAWLDTSNLSSFESSGGLVSEISDPRGNSIVFTQSNNSLKPQTGIESKNGLNVFTFGITSQMDLDLTEMLTNEEITIFAAVRDTDTGTNNRAYFDVFEDSTKIGIALQVFDFGGPAGEAAAFHDKNPAAAIFNALGGNIGAWNIAGGTRSKLDSHRIVSRVNATEVTALRASPADAVMDKMTFGRNRIQPSSTVTEIAEIVVYNKAFDLSGRNEIVQYLSDKWDIT